MEDDDDEVENTEGATRGLGDDESDTQDTQTLIDREEEDDELCWFIMNHIGLKNVDMKWFDLTPQSTPTMESTLGAFFQGMLN